MAPRRQRRRQCASEGVASARAERAGGRGGSGSKSSAPGLGGPRGAGLPPEWATLLLPRPPGGSRRAARRLAPTTAAAPKTGGRRRNCSPRRAPSVPIFSPPGGARCGEPGRAARSARPGRRATRRARRRAGRAWGGRWRGVCGEGGVRAREKKRGGASGGLEFRVGAWACTPTRFLIFSAPFASTPPPPHPPMVLGMGSASPRGGSAAAPPALEAAIRRLEAVADRLEGRAPNVATAPPLPASSGAPSGASPLADWDARVAPAVAVLVEAASGMDKEVSRGGGRDEREGSGCKRPKRKTRARAPPRSTSPSLLSIPLPRSGPSPTRRPPHLRPGGTSWPPS